MVLVTGALALCLYAAAMGVWSLLPRTPLHERPGFAAATQALARAWAAERSPNGFVVLWPPDQGASLQYLPNALRAADAVPIKRGGLAAFNPIWVIGPKGFAPPPELVSALEVSRENFAHIDVVTFRP